MGEKVPLGKKQIGCKETSGTADSKTGPERGIYAASPLKMLPIKILRHV
jgi:hypothetical protein